MLPTIHAIWLGDKMPPLALVCIDDWKKQGFKYRLWTDSDPKIQQWIKECKFSSECYKKKLYAFVTDYLRLKILQENGGLYLDTDVTIHKNPFILFQNTDFSVGYETDKFIGTAIIFAKKNSKILSEIIRFYETVIWDSDLYIGPQILTHLLIEKKLNTIERCNIYPIDYFYNYGRQEMIFEKPNNAYLTHWFQHSWKKSKNITFLKSKHLNFIGKLYVWQKYFFKRK